MSELFARGLAEHVRLADDLRGQLDLLARIGRTIIGSMEAGGRVYVIGNGGSAADAQHIAAELLGRFRLDRRALPAVALTTDTSTLLAIGNDYGFNQIFSRQIEGLVRAGDVLWALSTSGNSANIIEAANAARRHGAQIIGFAGRGGRLAPLCDLCLTVQHDASERIQEVHQIAYHLICEQVEGHFAPVVYQSKEHRAT